MSRPDARLTAFLSGRSPEIFHSIQHRHEIWRHDPFDVEDIHRPARTGFERLLNRAITLAGRGSGRIQLLLGGSGSGKTHLVRAFRNLAHEQSKGFVGYMQMTTAIDRYDRYVLSNLIDSLDQTYDELRHAASGLMRLSTALLSRCRTGVADLLRDDPDMDEEDVHQLIVDSADTLISQPGYERLDVDLIRALLYLQRDDARIKSRVLKYLRCEDLAERDRKVLGGMVPRLHADDPERMVEQLGRLMGALNHALVLCVDQLEDIYNYEDGLAPFRRAMSTLCSLADRVPSSVIVICCLTDFWAQMKPHLSQSMRDRIELDPDPISLEAQRTADEAREIVARRLAYLYEVEGAVFDEADPTYPLSPAGFEPLSGLNTRGVLNKCRDYRERAVKEGRLPGPFPLATGEPPRTEEPPGRTLLDLDQDWNDSRARHQGSLPEAEPEIAALLEWAIRASADELGPGYRFDARLTEERVEVALSPGDVRLAVAVCNRSPQGGHLGRQISRAQAAAGGRTLVIVRTTAFPDNPKSAIAEQLGRLLRDGGRRAVLEDSECRALLALRQFRERHQGHAALPEWLREARPLTQLKVLRDLLDLDRLPSAGQPSPSTPPAPAPVTVVASVPAAPRPPAASPGSRELRLGQADGLFAEPVLLSPDELTQHAAILGGSGSGKTTLALNLLEQLLLLGIPAILVDRKGDLAGYVRDEPWTRPVDGPIAQRRDQLRARIDVALFTPGHPGGRPLAIPLVPEGLARIPAFERQRITGHAADALGGMLDYRHTGRDKKCRVLLAQALDLLVQVTPDAELGLERLIRFIEDEDPALINAVGRLDPKLLRKLVEDLETLKLGASQLLATGGERLEMDLLLGRGRHARPGRTRLSVISTRFLGDNSRILFWVSQLLIELSRWTSQHPSGALQAVVLFDEADVYLPAVGQPATKQPMEDLLRRARSAGLGLLLATQSPGDFDYKCRDNIRTWLVGRVKEQTALNKMKPMLSEARGDVASKIPGQGRGEFHLLREGKVSRLRADPSCIPAEQRSEEELLLLSRRSAQRS